MLSSGSTALLPIARVMNSSQPHVQSEVHEISPGLLNRRLQSTLIDFSMITGLLLMSREAQDDLFTNVCAPWGLSILVVISIHSGQKV